MAKKEKKSKPESKTPELTKAKKALDAYLKENKLDPTKDWTKDKKHGKKVTELVNKLNKERDKVAAAYPEADQENNKKLVKLKEKEKKEKAEKKAAKEKKDKKGNGGRTATKYDYPLIDGREMTSAEKKKYRMEQRKLASGKAPKEEKTKKAKKETVEATEKAAPAKKDKKAKDKKKKKAAKEED
nr:MAG: hypothetical protein [Bacteriophage sp.]UVX74287.1 MAG: hypothetical protein [Bacteriophage sp.]UVX83299.1 MAG: hypothetical protein [Bacteriophage sp.]UVY38882.1 MAG: hypothetical protein [Bacteriophage sp.]UWG75919.1 MAG: hypothetical protein [Bacteriophage sp.]